MSRALIQETRQAGARHICRMSPPAPNASEAGESKAPCDRALLSLHESGAYGARIRRQTFTPASILGAFLLRWQCTVMQERKKKWVLA